MLGNLLYFPGIALYLWGRIRLGRMYGVSSTLGGKLYWGHRSPPHSAGDNFLQQPPLGRQTRALVVKKEGPA